jgi:hypothetical protein
MEDIQGMQLIFTRVEERYSPKRKSGFQVVYHSKGLSNEEVEALQLRVRCYQPRKEPQARFQFFRLPTGNFALAYSAPIESHAEINDVYKAPGMYLAHCLVFTPQEFARAGNNPFKIFDAYRFVKMAVTMVDEFNQADFQEPACRVEVDPWSPGALRGGESWWPCSPQWVSLVESAQTTLAKSNSLLLYGEEAGIHAALRAIFELAPLEARTACSFDTHIDGCSVKTGQYWAAGTASRQDQPFIPIDVSGYQVSGFKPDHAKGSLYQDWLRWATQADQPQRWKHLPTIHELCESFADQRWPVLESCAPEACDTFYGIHKQQVLQTVDQVMIDATNNQLGPQLLNHGLNRDIPSKHLLAFAAAQSIPARYLTDLARSWLQKIAPEFSEFGRGDWKKLQELAIEAPDDILLFWAAVLGRSRKQHQDVLEKISADDYSKSLDMLNRGIEPVDFVTPRHIQTLMLKVQQLQFELNDDQFIDLILAVVEIDMTAHLERISRRVLQMDARGLKKLENHLKKVGSIPQSFRQAMEVRRDQLGPANGMMDWLASKTESLLGKEAGTDEPVKNNQRRQRRNKEE